MARPREGHVVEELRECREHGMVMKRRHKHVVRRGRQQYLWRCPRCHDDHVRSIQARKAA